MLDLRDLKGAIKQIVQEKGLQEEKIWEAIELAIAKAYKKEYLNKHAQVRATIDKDSGKVSFYRIYSVVDDTMVIPVKIQKDLLDAMENSEAVPLVENEGEQSIPVEEEEEVGDEIDEETKKIRFNSERHMMVEDAKAVNKKIEAGQELVTELQEEDSFTRIAAQSAKQTIIQQLRELEKENIISEYENKEGEIVSGVIQKIDRGTVIVHLGKALGILSAKEAIPFERFQTEERKKFLILGIREMKGSLAVWLSRTHPQFIVKLLSLEVPEIQEGIVEIKAIAREPGYRTKIAVFSNQPEVDAVGSCIGPKGVRVNTLIEEIPNEKIDVVEYSEEPATFVANALSPVKIKETEIDPGKKEVKVFVAPDLLSAVIGKNGQNVRLASKLTGWNIKVYSTVAPDYEQAEAEAVEKPVNEQPLEEGYDEDAEETLEVKKVDEEEIEINKE